MERQTISLEQKLGKGPILLGNQTPEEFIQIAEELGFKSNFQQTSGLNYELNGVEKSNIKYSPTIALVLPIYYCYPCKK